MTKETYCYDKRDLLLCHIVFPKETDCCASMFLRPRMCLHACMQAHLCVFVFQHVFACVCVHVVYVSAVCVWMCVCVRERVCKRRDGVPSAKVLFLFLVF